MRRATIAHELGHLLFDPPQRLQTLRVDAFEDLERSPELPFDPVEQRANAFMVEFIAPRADVVAAYRKGGPDALWATMDAFGLGFTAMRYQIWNGLEKKAASFEALRLLPVAHRSPDPQWEGREGYTVDWHPLGSIRPTRAGRFSAVVFRAAERGVISWDTATSMLEVNIEVLRESGDALRELFPVVFVDK